MSFLPSNADPRYLATGVCVYRSASGFPYMVVVEDNHFSVRFMNSYGLDKDDDLWVDFPWLTDNMDFDIMCRLKAWELTLTDRKRAYAEVRARVWQFAEESTLALKNDMFDTEREAWAIDLSRPKEVC